VIVDGMSLFFEIEPAGRYKEVAKPLALLNRLCRREQLTVLLVHHGAKQSADKGKRYARQVDRVLGSMALLGFTTCQFQITEPELTEEPRLGLHQLTVMPHSTQGLSTWLQRGPDGFTELEGGLTQARRDYSEAHPWTPSEVQIGILGVLNSNWTPVALLIQAMGAAGYPRTTASRGLRGLILAGEVFEETIEGKKCVAKGIPPEKSN
jgi:hypothetical protein